MAFRWAVVIGACAVSVACSDGRTTPNPVGFSAFATASAASGTGTATTSSGMGGAASSTAASGGMSSVSSSVSASSMASSGAGGMMMAASSSGMGGSTPMIAPDFGLQDTNTASPRFGQTVSPRDYLKKVSGWYFGHAT
jgi:hypothetical protein